MEQQANDVAGPLLPRSHQHLRTETDLFTCDYSNVIRDPLCDLGRRYIGNSLLAFFIWNQTLPS